MDAQEKVGKAHARAGELEKQVRMNQLEDVIDYSSFVLALKFFLQVDNLKKEIETQKREKVTLETRVIEAEEQIHGLNTKLENVCCVSLANSNSASIISYVVMAGLGGFLVIVIRLCPYFITIWF